MSFATIPELIEDIRAGRMVVVVDDEDRDTDKALPALTRYQPVIITVNTPAGA